MEQRDIADAVPFSCLFLVFVPEYSPDIPHTHHSLITPPSFSDKPRHRARDGAADLFLAGGCGAAAASSHIAVIAIEIVAIVDARGSPRLPPPFEVLVASLVSLSQPQLYMVVDHAGAIAAEQPLVLRQRLLLQIQGLDALPAQARLGHRDHPELLSE